MVMIVMMLIILSMIMIVLMHNVVDMNDDVADGRGCRRGASQGMLEMALGPPQTMARTMQHNVCILTLAVRQLL